VPVTILRHLASLVAYDAAFPVGPDGPEPLCALWGPKALALLARQVAAGRFALHPVLAHPTLHAHVLEGEELEAFGDPGEIFRNLNRPEDVPAGGSPPGG
jgi:molybdopterin-guanine dinucleotide biosynthesis protein A